MISTQEQLLRVVLQSTESGIIGDTPQVRSFYVDALGGSGKRDTPLLQVGNTNALQ